MSPKITLVGLLVLFPSSSYLARTFDATIMYTPIHNLKLQFQVNNGDEAVDTKLEQKIALIQACAEHNPGKHLDITLSFYERRQHQGWFAHQEQRIYWEQWRIHLAILSSDTSLLERHTLEADAFRAARKKTLQHLLEDCLLRIVTAVDRKRDHLPPVISGSPLTYPFDIKFAARATIVSNTSSSSSSSVSPATVQKESSDTTAAESESSVFGLDFVRRILSSSNPPSVLH